MSTVNYESSNGSSPMYPEYMKSNINFHLVLSDSNLLRDPTDCNMIIFCINYVGLDGIMISDKARCSINTITLKYGSALLEQKTFYSYFEFLDTISPRLNRMALVEATADNSKPGYFLELDSMSIVTVSEAPFGHAKYSIGDLVNYLHRPKEVLVVCDVRQTSLQTNQYILMGENDKTIMRTMILNGRSIEVSQWIDEVECFAIWIDETKSFSTTI